MKSLRKIRIIKVKKLSKDRDTDFVWVTSRAKKKCGDLVEDPEEWLWLCFRRGWKVNDGCDFASVGSRKVNDGCDFTSVGSRKVKNGQDLASAGDLVPKQTWSCICRGSTYQRIQIMVTLLLQGVEKINEGYDFASAGSQKITNVILHLQRINISTNSSNGDFASAGSRENKWRLWLSFCRESENNEWPRPCFCRGSSAKTNVTLLLQRVNISKLLDPGIIFY